MSVIDPIGDMLARIRNAQLRNKGKVSMPGSKLRERVLEVLKSEGFIRGYAAVAHASAFAASAPLRSRTQAGRHLGPQRRDRGIGGCQDGPLPQGYAAGLLRQDDRRRFQIHQPQREGLLLLRRELQRLS